MPSHSGSIICEPARRYTAIARLPPVLRPWLSCVRHDPSPLVGATPYLLADASSSPMRHSVPACTENRRLFRSAAIRAHASTWFPSGALVMLTVSGMARWLSTMACRSA